MLFFTYCLLASVLANVDAVDPCESPQYVVLGETGTIQCNFTAGFFGIFWYNTTDYINEYSVLNLRRSKISGPGYNSGEFNIYPNGSLRITEVTLQHNTNFTVVKLNSAFDEVVPHFVTVIVQAFPTPPYPVIEGCYHQRSCAVKVAHHDNLTCSVAGIHPLVELAWKISCNKSTINLLQTSQHTTRRLDGRFDIELVSEFFINNTSEYSQTVKCIVVPTVGAPALHLESEISLLFPDEASPVDHMDRDDSTYAGPKGLLVFLIVFVTVMVTCVSVVAFFLIRRARGTNHSQIEDCAEVKQEETPLMDKEVTPKSKDLKTLITKLKERYKQIYDATQPIPHIRSKNENMAKVFIESNLQSLNFREGVGKHGIWENVESLETVLRDQDSSSQKFILEGDHGYIKSTLGIELAYDWCTDTKTSFTKKFEILIYLKLSQLQGTLPTFKNLSTILLGFDMKIGEKNIQEILTDSSNVGVLLDGFNYSPGLGHVEPLDVIKLVLSPVFKPFTVVLISTPSFLTNIYHFGEIKRLRVIGIDRHKRDAFVTAKVASTAHELSRSVKSGKNDSDSLKKRIVLIEEEKESSEMRKMPHEGTTFNETGTTEQQEKESDSPIKDSEQKNESDQAKRHGDTETEGDFSKCGTSATKQIYASETVLTTAEEEIYLPFDLLEIPLFFSVLSKTYTGRVNHQSLTTFFSEMIKSLEQETADRNEIQTLKEEIPIKPEQQILNTIGFEGITFDKKKTKFWSKNKLSEQIGPECYDACKLKGYFIEEGVQLSNKSGSNDARFEVQVRFSNTFFCEWFAAQHIQYMRESLSRKDREDWKRLVIKLASNDYWYCLRFLCGLNQGTADQVLKLLKDQEGLQFFCALEKHGSIMNTLDTVQKILPKKVHIRLKDSKLQQMSIIQLLHTAARNQISIQHLFLEDCLNGPSSLSSDLALRSGLELPILDTLVQLHIIEKGRTLTKQEAEEIFIYFLQCSYLKHVTFSNCLLPQNIPGINLPGKMEAKNLQVEWKPQSNARSFLFDFESRQWMVMKKKKMNPLTNEEYYDVVNKYNNF